MPTYQFEAMDSTGQEIKDVIDAPTEAEAQATIRQMGYFITKISVKKERKQKADKKTSGKKRSFAIGGVSGKLLTTFTRQLSILQDAGLPILRSLRILETQQKPGRLKNALMDVGDEIESGATLSEAMAKSPKVFNRLYINMIKAGEAGGALEVILRRLSEFLERSESLKRKVKGAMIYPVIVILVAVGILTFIMLKIVPVFQKMFEEFGLELPVPTKILINISNWVVQYLRYSISQLVASARGAASRRHGRRWASRPREIRPAFSSTLRCLEIAGWLMANGSASSMTEASPCASRARMARRVGSDSAWKVASRLAAAGIINP